jgi:hypothetical protein
MNVGERVAQAVTAAPGPRQERNVRVGRAEACSGSAAATDDAGDIFHQGFDRRGASSGIGSGPAIRCETRPHGALGFLSKCVQGLVHALLVTTLMMPPVAWPNSAS